MRKVFLKFTRRANVVEVGGAAVYAEDSDTLETIEARARNGEFAEFLITDRVYVDQEIEFGSFDEDGDDDEDDDEYDYEVANDDDD